MGIKEYLKHLFNYKNFFKPSSLRMFNLVLLTSIAVTGAVQYYMREAPFERSLLLSIGALVALLIYLPYTRKKPRKTKK